ncbi:MAG TPA: hypothetical protein VFI68_08010, partial [Anaerolineales bacterium]|nr:hypothetical protein [Anaerolineales bacterium]
SEPQALLYPKAPIEIAPMDGSNVFIPRFSDGALPVTERAFNILWSPEKHILAFEVEEMNQTAVWIYQLSPDLETIISSYSFYRIESYPIAAWWVPGESIVLRTGEIWSISEKIVVDRIH